MTTWNQKAREAFPDLTTELEEFDATIYALFFELLPRCIEAHVVGNTSELQKIYGFAEWCMGSDEQDVWNAAGVAFFEHLVDQAETLDQIPLWLSPNIFVEVVSLFAARMEPQEFADLKGRYVLAHPCVEKPLISKTKQLVQVLQGGEGI